MSSSRKPDSRPAPAPRRQFASDNWSGICPEAWKALADANCGHAPAYGEDAWTARASSLLREVFEHDAEIFFVFNGTAANSLALASLCRSYHSVICHERSHAETDECGAPEFYSSGTKILLVPGNDGKVDLEAVRHTVKKRTDIHYPKPRVLSVSQATELGTVYTRGEVTAAGAVARELGLRLHMDGARFANALASTGVSPAEMSWKAGVDVLCLGGTKNGMPVGEAIIFFDKELAREFDYRCKQAGQLASKMRFIAAPWIGLLEGDAWLRHAGEANARAAELEDGLRKVPGVRILYPRQANSVFSELPSKVGKGLRARGWRFYEFIAGGGARFMCSWDTTSDDVATLVRDAQDLAAEACTPKRF
ncbi:MAG: low specificity L-threonine aldolase [Verrucomicrobiae bacterium]|nr:low specificity L-threonine aldolase [Verrucomicrobiae bacterium]